MDRYARWQMIWAALLVSTVVLFGTRATAQNQANDGAASQVAEVTLYRDQAQIVRTVVVPAGEGPVEVTVVGLPEQVVADSLFAEGGELIDVRAVRFRQRVVGEEPREEIRELDGLIETKQIEIEENAAMQSLIQERLAYLDKLSGFVAPTATAELSQGVLDAEQLQQTTRFIFSERREATTERLALNSAARVLNRELQTLQQRRAQIAGRTQRVVREAVLFLDRRDANADAVRLTYLVNNCGWSPSYNVRGKLEDASVRVEYNALIRQMTGEDWNGVKLTLSTASPMLSAAGPGIASFPISLQAIARGGQAPADPSANAPDNPSEQIAQAEAYFSLRDEQRRNAFANGRATNFDDNVNVAWSGNSIANRTQLMEIVLSNDGITRQGADHAFSGSGQPARGLSITYELPGTVSLQSRSDQQMTRIMQSELDGTFYHVASPVLSPFVYREAEAVNTSGNDLLAGPVSVYLDGKFVGRTEIVSVTRGQTFVLGFGADPQLTTSRQLVKREQTSQGGNTVLSFDYRLAIENYGNQPAQVRLMDRLPHFKGSDDVKLTIASMSEPLSEDSVYLRLDRPEGILQWDIEVPANATGAEEQVVSYLYTLEFDRNYGFSIEAGDQHKQDFEERQMRRQAR